MFSTFHCEFSEKMKERMIWVSGQQLIGQALSILRHVLLFVFYVKPTRVAVLHTP